jgi:hypothetical protein
MTVSEMLDFGPRAIYCIPRKSNCSALEPNDTPVLGRKVIANASVDQERSSKAAGKLKAGAGRQRGFAISR